MQITSFYFFCLFGVSLLLYYLVPKKIQWCLLLAYSVFFFVRSSGLRAGIFTLINIVATWFFAMGTAKARLRGDQGKSRMYMVSGVFVNVAILAILKYSGFLVYNLNLLSSWAKGKALFHAPCFDVPIGISFYTLMCIGYLADVYWEITEPEKNLCKAALFVGYYPQMTSGPISRFEDVRKQLYAGHKFEYKNLAFGLQRMLWGLFKKLVISARAAILVDAVYASPETYRGLYVWAAALLFMLQLYTDFSGCMDIILGASECYGIKLAENFRTPFFSRNVQEFWQRWHITLGAWLKDYVLYPILRSGNFRRLSRRLEKHIGKKASMQLMPYLGMLAVWLLIGLWHGGGWKYILGQGLWFWLCIVLEQAAAPYSKKLTVRLRIDTGSFSWHLLQSARVLLLVSAGNMFFRLDGMAGTVAEMKNGFASWNPWIFFGQGFVDLGLSDRDRGILAVGVLALFAVAALQEKYGHAREWAARQILPFRWAIWILLFACVLIYGTYGPGFDAADFIYRGF